MEGVIVVAQKKIRRSPRLWTPALAGLLLIVSCSLFGKTVEVIPGYTVKFPYGYHAVDAPDNRSMPNSAVAQSRALEISRKGDSSPIQLTVTRVEASGAAKSITSLLDAAMGSKLGKSVLSKTVASKVCTFDARGYQPPGGKATVLTASCDEQGKSWLISWVVSGDCAQECQGLFEKVLSSLSAKK